jgi:hypothetical protein
MSPWRISVASEAEVQAAETALIAAKVRALKAAGWKRLTVGNKVLWAHPDYMRGVRLPLLGAFKVANGEIRDD